MSMRTIKNSIFLSPFEYLLKKIRTVSLEKRLFICFFLIAIIPTVFMGLVSYNRAYNSLEDKISRSSQQVVNQTVSTLDYILKEYSDNLKQVYTSEIFQSEIKTITNSERELEKLTAIKNINKILRAHFYSKDNIYGIAVMFNDRDLCLEEGKYFIDTNYKNSPIYIDTLNTRDTLWNATVNSEDVRKELSFKGQGVISLSRNIVSTESLDQVGVIAMAIRKELLLDVISPVELEKGSGIVILDENNNIVLSRTNVLSDELLTKDALHRIEKEIGGEIQGCFTLDYNRDKFLINYGSIPENDWEVISFIPYSHIMEQTEDIKRYVFYVFTLCTILSIVVSKVLSVILVKPLKKLELSMRQIEHGSFGGTVSLSECEEFIDIERRFNMMSTRLKDLMNEIKVKEKEKMEAEFRFLQSQINPHFLYNTLDSIKGMIVCNKKEEALLSLEKLSEIFKAVLKQSDKEIPLVQELNHVENYLTIQKLRNVDKMDYEIYVDENIIGMNILRFILQPIVENAIYHGIRQKKGKGFIIISCRLQGGDVIIEIKDTGIGIDTTTLDNINRELVYCENDNIESGRGIGITNVNRRIKLFYGENYGLVYESVEGEWTKAIIKVPYIKAIGGGTEDGGFKDTASRR